MSSNEMETTPTLDKAALTNVLNYLRTKKLKDTEEALRKELSLIGQTEYSDISAPSIEVSSLGSSGTEPSKYEESYAGLSSTPSTSTTTDLQSVSTEDTSSRSRASTEDILFHSRPTSISTVQDDDDDELIDENHFDSDPSTLEVSSGKQLPNLLEVSYTSRPAHLTLNSHLITSSEYTGLTSPVQSPPLTNPATSPVLNKGQVLTGLRYKRSTSEHSVESANSPSGTQPSQFPMANPLIYQVGATGQRILTPILTVLPSTSLINPITAAALQAGGQPIIFNSTAVSQSQVHPNTPLVKPPRVTSPEIPVSQLPLSMEPPKSSPSTASPPRTLASLMLTEMTPQYLELKAFAEEFKTKRIRLGFTQGAVGQSLAQKGYNNFAQSTISRFEQLQLSPANAAAIKQVLEKWLQEAECPNAQPSSVSSSSSVGSIMNCRKRKKRAVFTAQTRNTLDEFFKQNPRPNRQLIEGIANELNLLPEEVRVWFCNKRQKSKQSPSFERESSVSTSSFIDSPPSFFEKGRSPSPPKTPFTIEELSKSSVSMTTSPCQSTSPVQISTLSLVRPLSSSGVYPMVFSLPPSPPRLLQHSPPVAQTTA